MAKQTPSIEPCDDGPDDREGVVVKTPYHPGWLESLKAQVPWQDRRWWEDSRAWWVAAEHADVVEHLTLNVFGEVEVVDEDGVIETRTGGGERLRQGGLFE